MDNYRISEHDAEAVVGGRAPHGHPELVPLANSLAEYRHVAVRVSTSPQPSAALVAYLDGTRSAPIRTSGVRTARSPRQKRILGGVFGLGVGINVVFGVAIGAAAVTGAGVAGVLPPVAQHAFDTVVSSVAPHDGIHVDDNAPLTGSTDGSTTPQDDTTVGGGVQDRARDLVATHDAGDDSTAIADESTPVPEDSSKGGSGNGNSGSGDSGSGSGDSGSSSGSGSGDSNSGNGNSGSGNSGNGNSGSGNSGNGNSGKNDK
ncbi:MAG: hypothetical protein JWP19_1282 [Rhodoglobus sp.]|nr:hypothetical protein [Rhodoglobus sp.]